MRNNIVTAVYAGGCYTRTEALVQYDYGQILHLSGFGLPAAFQVDFGTSRIAGETVQVIGALDHVAIPDTLLQGAANIYAFIRLHTGEDDGETVFVVELPVMARPEITGEEPTPVEQDLIDQLMAALAAGVAAAEAAAAQIERMSAEASTLPAGSPATAAWDAEHGKLLLGIPKGDTGANGAEGPEGPEGPAGSDGYSPTVTVEEITGGHRVTITDAEGDHVFDVMDGQGGAPGAGVPAGGTTGQVLKKASGTDFDTEWADETGGGGSGLTDEIKQAILTIAEKVAYIDENGQAYYDSLMLALYPESGHRITNTLSHCTNSNAASAILDGESYVATITADDGYKLSGGTITITMGGEDITASAYSGGYANGTIQIASVTDDVVIAVTAAAETLPEGYTRYDYIYNLTSASDNKNDLIDTGINSIYCDTEYIHEVVLATINISSGTNNGIYGCRNTSGSAGAKNGNCFWLNTTDKIAVGYNGVDSGYNLPFTWGQKHTVKLDTGKVYIDGVLVSSPTATRTSYSTSSIRLFGVATAESSYSGVHGTMKFYSVMITDSSDGNVIAKLVPCKNSSDTAGVYDLVSGTFHYATNYSNYAVANEA